jgi:hypothetical protein
MRKIGQSEAKSPAGALPLSKRYWRLWNNVGGRGIQAAAIGRSMATACSAVSPACRRQAETGERRRDAGAARQLRHLGHRRQEGGVFRHVEATAAADADDEIGREAAGLLGTPTSSTALDDPFPQYPVSDPI